MKVKAIAGCPLATRSIRKIYGMYMAKRLTLTEGAKALLAHYRYKKRG
jgi:hypothetical protein